MIAEWPENSPKWPNKVLDTEIRIVFQPEASDEKLCRTPKSNLNLVNQAHRNGRNPSKLFWQAVNVLAFKSLQNLFNEIRSTPFKRSLDADAVQKLHTVQVAKRIARDWSQIATDYKPAIGEHDASRNNQNKRWLIFINFEIQFGLFRFESLKRRFQTGAWGSSSESKLKLTGMSKTIHRTGWTLSGRCRVSGWILELSIFFLTFHSRTFRCFLLISRFRSRSSFSAVLSLAPREVHTNMDLITAIISCNFVSISVSFQF